MRVRDAIENGIQGTGNPAACRRILVTNLALCILVAGIETDVDFRTRSIGFEKDATLAPGGIFNF